MDLVELTSIDFRLLVLGVDSFFSFKARKVNWIESHWWNFRLIKSKVWVIADTLFVLVELNLVHLFLEIKMKTNWVTWFWFALDLS